MTSLILNNDFELFKFQQPGYDKLVRAKKRLLLYRMGLGKTVVGVKAAYDIKAKSILVLTAKKNAIPTWVDHFNRWYPGLDAKSGEKTPVNLWYWGKKHQDQGKRRALWRSRLDGVNIYITTIQGFLADREFFYSRYDLIILDEAKRIRNRKSKAFEALKPLVKDSPYFWPMTGTPGRLPGDFWTMFHLCDPKLFSSYWRFVQTFLWTQKDPYNGHTEILGWKNLPAWELLLKQYADIRTKSDGAEMKPTKQLLPVEMDEHQTRIYGQLAGHMFAETTEGGDYVFAQNSMVRTLKFRQLLVCPKILDPLIPSYGAALEDLIDTLKDTDPHVVIFTPFTEAMPYMQERLKQSDYSNVFQLKGGVSPDELTQTIAEFRRTRGIMLCSILFAESFSLEPATECFFIGYDFDPENNDQALYRLQRLTTKVAISGYFYAYEGTYDQRLCEIVNLKQQLINQTIPKELFDVPHN